MVGLNLVHHLTEADVKYYLEMLQAEISRLETLVDMQGQRIKTLEEGHDWGWEVRCRECGFFECYYDSNEAGNASVEHNLIKSIDAPYTYHRAYLKKKIMKEIGSINVNL
jgi:hypothetical protein